MWILIRFQFSIWNCSWLQWPKKELIDLILSHVYLIGYSSSDLRNICWKMGESELKSVKFLSTNRMRCKYQLFPSMSTLTEIANKLLTMHDIIYVQKSVWMANDVAECNWLRSTTKDKNVNVHYRSVIIVASSTLKCAIVYVSS